MEIKQQTKLLFFGVDIVDFHFRSVNPYDGKQPVDLNINPKIFFLKDIPNQFKIIMGIILQSKDYFELSLSAIGSFQLEGEMDKNLKKNFINTNAPAIMFPYVRSFVTTFTSNIGIASTPLILPPQFFKGDIPVLSESEMSKHNPDSSMNETVKK